MATSGDEIASSTGDSLQILMAAFNRRAADLKEMILLRHLSIDQYGADLAALDTSIKALERQLQAIKAHLRHEAEGLPSTQDLVERSQQQQRKLQSIAAHLPAHLPNQSGRFSQNGSETSTSYTTSRANESNKVNEDNGTETAPSTAKVKKEPRGVPRKYVTMDELKSLSSYMKGRLTLDKVNAAVDDMASFAEANAQLLSAPRKKLGEDALKKVLELRELTALEGVKGQAFFLEFDMRSGTHLKMDTTGKSILTVLRHLGRITEVRARGQRVLVLSR
ncbi:hypothetical protein KFL_008400060 [Klebsormidium nitens]|uniref:SKA complex subunit 1 homolog n=1 Tax=Klebsormidium nitens TaxID=105231 RepID=A0A1Y1IU68_KLENI|nr:hypothetical protein KFL_008400060 [Klebsormidium nitens]|eukprot:GAQ91728.1 hypothetical protein KFL_008400060 [Klebsormidium nitens]